MGMGEMEAEAQAFLFKAVAQAQSEFTSIIRTKEVDTGKYKFEYAPLDVILAAVRPTLHKNGLGLVQLLGEDERGDYVTTMLTHEAGGYLSSKARIASATNGPQAFGSALTYMRRYSVQCILGIATEADDDGNTAEGTAAKVVDRARNYTPVAQVAYSPPSDYIPPRKMTPTAPPANKGVSVSRLQELGKLISRLGIYSEQQTTHEKKAAVYAWSGKMLNKSVTDWSELTSDEVTLLEAAAGAGQV